MRVTAVQQSVEQMQPVGEFVALGPQHRAHQLDGIELTCQRFNVGAVAHDQYRAQLASLPRHRPGRHDQDTVPDGGQGGCGIAGPQHLQDPRRQSDLIDRMSGCGTNLEQVASLVVDERGVAVGISGKHPFADTVQHRFLGAHQFGHLCRLQIQRLLPPAPGQQRGKN